VIPVSAELLRAADPVALTPGSPIVARYGAADNVPIEVAELARETTADAATTYDKIEALEAMIEERVTDDAVDHRIAQRNQGQISPNRQPI
jgi:hypothetical protein